MSDVRTHFSKAKEEIQFPDWLLYHRYVLDEWESKLILSPDHVSGEKVTSVDLRYWDNLHDVMKVISQNSIQLEDMDLRGNNGADGKCLAQASRLFGKTLTSLNLAGSPSIDETALAFLGGFSILQTLDLSDILHIQDYHVEKLLDYNLRMLEHLTINGCIQLTNRSLECVARQRNRIKTLNATTNTNYTWHGVVEVLYNCEALNCVDFSHCPNVRFFGCITRLSNHPLDRDLKQFVSRSLKKLRLEACEDLDEDSLDYICGALLELEEVSLPYIRAVSDPAVQALATGCPNLTFLHVQGCTAVKNEAIKTLGLGACADRLLDVNIANVGRFSGEAMGTLLRGCTRLRYLNASNNSGIVDSVFAELELPPAYPGGSPTPIMLPNLERLSIACTGLSSFGVACMAERCVNLVHLDISEHKHITNACLSVIAGCCRRLKSLWLNDCPALTDHGVLEIAYNCKWLEVLHLSSSIRYIDAWNSRFRQYSDTVLEAILDGLRCLKELSMRNQCDIHMRSPWLLMEFSRRGGHQFLEKVDLRGVDELDLDGAAVVFQHCSELCYALMSPTEHLEGVQDVKFWESAFSGCLYTARHGIKDGVGAKHKAVDDARLARLQPGSRLDEASVASSLSKAASVFTPVTQTEEGVAFHTSIEHGRYYSDDGTTSVISCESRKIIDSEILEAFKDVEAHTAASIASKQKKSGTAGGGMSRTGTAASHRAETGSRSGRGLRPSSHADSSRPGTSSSAHGGQRGVRRPGTAMSDADDIGDSSDLDIGAANGDDDIVSIASQGGVSVLSLIEKVHSLAEFSTSKKRGLPRASTSDKAKRDAAAAGGKSAPLTDVAEKKANLVPAGYLALQGHPERKKYRYRDFYIRRMLEEQSCMRFIQFKYKLWAFWQRLRKRVSARRIANSYKVILEKRKLATHVKAMARINAARRIQRYFKFKKMPYVHASVKIQKIYRGHRCKSLLLRMAQGENAAIVIQKLMRGALVRISERFIISQIYLKLPPFWRAICGYKNPDGLDEAVRKKLFLHQVTDAKNDSRKVVLKITQEVLRDGILAPQLPHIVAQPFDKKPYASMNDGRKIAIYSHTEGILWNDTGKTTKRMLDQKQQRMHRLKYDEEGRDLTKPRNRKNLGKEDLERLDYLASLEDHEPEHASMHQYNIKFWPHTKPLKLSDPSTEQHDPMVNNFDALAGERTVLFCEVCHTRLRIIHCSTCIRGYCFYCAFRTHTDPGRRQHKMEMFEPRVVHEAKVGKSLIFHLDMAQQASHDLKYLVKYMRSKGEVQRIQAEKKMAAEFEAAEEARRRAFLLAQGESNDRHSAATEISLLFRKKKSRRIVMEKRRQLALEKVTAEEGKFPVRWIGFQRLFRLYSTRRALAEMGKGYVFRLDGKRKGKRKIGSEAAEVPRDVRDKLNQRIAYENQQRRVTDREVMMEKLIQAHAQVITILDANIEYWVHMDEHLPTEIEHYEEHKGLVSKEHEELSSWTAAQKAEVHPDDYEILEGKLDAVYKKVECAQLCHENSINMRWWIAQHLRNAYRRRSALKVRLQDTIDRLKWNLVESGIISRVEVHCDARIKQFTPILGMGMATSWLQRYGEHPKTLQATLDAQQETILLEELNRLERDRHQTMEFDSLLEELYLGLNADNHLAKERVALDVAQLSGELEKGSDLALRTAEGLMAIKLKQTQLNSNVLDTLKLGLQAKLNEEDDRMMQLYSFPNDSPELTLDEFYKIEKDVCLIDPFVGPHHFKLETFMHVYYVQPWLAEEAVKDVRLEEAIRRKFIEKGKLEEELRGVKTTIQDNDEKSVLLRKQIQDLEHEVDIRSNVEADEEETEEEKTERLELVNTLAQELFKKSGEVDVCVEVNAKIKESIDPLTKQVEEKDLEAKQLEVQLIDRNAERERLRGIFFETEIKENHDLFETVAASAAEIEAQHLKVQARQTALKAVVREDVESLEQRLQNDDFLIPERDILRYPSGTQVHVLQDLLAEKAPRTTCRYVHQMKVTTGTRMALVVAHLSVLEELKILIEHEEDMMNNFEKEIPRYKKTVELFTQKLLAQRRQKAMQVELEQRKLRLADLRAIRMRQLKEAKEKLEEEAKEAELAKQKKIATRVPIGKRVAKAVKQSIRGAKDFINELSHSAATAMDQEELRMAANMRKNNSSADAKPEGIRKLHITHGAEETEAFGRQQRTLEERGIPFYHRMERNFGNQFFLWYELTFDNQQMITNLDFCSSIEGEETYQDPEARKKDKWEAYGHHDLKMIMWAKRDLTKIRAFRNFEVSVSMAEENRNLVEGFEKFEQCLDAFGLPEMYLWFKKIDKIAHSMQMNVNELINEVEKTRELLKKNPGDRNMQNFMDRLVDKLKVAHTKEQANIVTNPLRQIVDLLSLTPIELEAWMQVFEKIDRDKEGAVTFDQIFEFFEETPTLFARDIFTGMDALDEYGTVEFGDFVRAVGTYCFFGKEEMLKSLFVFADKDNKGDITHAQFVTLLNSLNPFDKSRAKRALQELQMIPDKAMKFDEFARLNDEFPNIMHPAFRLQHAMRQKILGDDWWFDKLSKYKGVRAKLTQSGANIDKMAQLEMDRFKADEAKVRRMKERDTAIRNEPSAIRKAYLEAQQFLDEFS